MAKKYNLAEWKLTRLAEAGVPIELSDGTEIIVPPGDLWSTEAWAALNANSIDEAAPLILGAQSWERFTADGGTAMLLSAILSDSNETTPGGSGASSS